MGVQQTLNHQKVCILMSNYIGICRRNFSCFECGRAFRVPQKNSPIKSPTKLPTKSQKVQTTSNRKTKSDKMTTPPVPKKIKVSGVESPPEADTLDITFHFTDLVVSKIRDK